MPALAALLHTHNDALRLGRCLETLYPCDEILIVDHGSEDSTIAIARQFGARVIQFSSTAPPVHLQIDASGCWFLCLDACESLTEALAASLYEWKSRSSESLAAPAFSVFLREETAAGWIMHAMPQTRLVPLTWKDWNGGLPMHDYAATTLEGELLRFIFP